MSGLDDLDDYVDNAPPENGAVPETTASAIDAVVDAMTLKDAKALYAWSARYHVEDDAFEAGLILATRASLAGAAAAGQSAQAVQAGVSAIPGQIFAGAVKASDEVKGGLISGGKLFAEAFTRAAADRQSALIAAAQSQQTKILEAAGVGAEKIRTAASALTGSLDAAIKAKRDEGVSEFAREAAVAASSAAKSSMLAQASRSAGVMLAIIAVSALLGAAGLWGYLRVEHEIMPTGFYARAAMGGGSVVRLPLDGRTHQCGGGGYCVRFAASIPNLPVY